MATTDHPLGASIHLDARTITVSARAPGAVFLTLTVGMNEVCISGTLTELRAVADAIAAAIDEIEGEGDVHDLTEEAAALSPENPEAV